MLCRQISGKKKENQRSQVNLPSSTKSRVHDSGRNFETDSGIPVGRVYGPKGKPSVDRLGLPGETPFTRGIYPNMYRERLWTIREYGGFGNARDTNKRFRYLLNLGQTGLSVAFDLPTQLGLDSDNARSQGEVGKVGVAISTLENMRTLFSGIPIDKVSTSMTINATASTMLAMYVTLAESRGVSRSILTGTTQNDILKEYAARNTYIYPPDRSLNLCLDIITFCADEMPKWHPISISGYHMREAGANAIQELAFTFSDAVEYVKGIVSRGYKIDSFCKQLSFFFACRNDFFEEVAKFRAARRIWARIVKDRFHSVDPESMRLKFHVQTSGETLTAQQPENNAVRVSLQGLAAVLGGAQSIHTNSKDEALGLPTEGAATLALRTQQIIAEETGVTKTVDPAGGSYYLEHLTDELESRAMVEFDRIQKMGGALAAIKSGYIQSEIQKSAYEFQRAVDEGRTTIVGVNKFTESASSASIETLEISRESAKEQIRALNKFRSQRDQNKVNGALRNLENEAEKQESQEKANLVPLIIESVKSGATTGEVSNALREAFGEYHPQLVI
jgi:methylmalonyl-CoA mutase, N-terminal domain